MREFKFIRGIYTNENIFNTDEISNCLFAYDSKGELVSFNEVNNDVFQQKFLSPDRISKIYTFRPSQFTISATKEGNSYPFTFVANKMTYDNSESIPENVRKAAESYIESQTTANIKTTGSIPKLNIEGNPIEKTTVEFTFDDKTFTRNLVFKVSGKLEESGYLLANGKTTAYSDITDDSSKKSGVFYNGHYQSEVRSQQKDVILNPLEVSNADNLNIATSYTPKDGFIFVVNGQIKSSVNYSDDLEFLLYTKTQNNNGNTIIENGTTYYFVGKCTVKSRVNGEIVKGYETSYEGKYILKDSKLIQVTESDLIENNLTDGKLAIYDSDKYHIIDENVYEDDSLDTKEYFMHISDKNPLEKNITNENAYVNEKGVVSPLITENIFRQITIINVDATQSDD